MSQSISIQSFPLKTFSVTDGIADPLYCTAVYDAINSLPLITGLNVLRQVAVNICIATGMTLIVLTAGIDLSVGSVLALCGAVTAGLLKNGIVITFR